MGQLCSRVWKKTQKEHEKKLPKIQIEISEMRTFLMETIILRIEQRTQIGNLKSKRKQDF